MPDKADKKWTTLQKLTRLLVAPTVEPSQRAIRIQAVEKDIVLPIKALLIVILFYYFYLYGGWTDASGSPKDVTLHLIKEFFLGYVTLNALAGTLIWTRQLPLRKLQWLVVAVGSLDGLLMAALTYLTEGSDSPIYWVFMALILHNALAIPLALPQLLLNLFVSVGFFLGAFADRQMAQSNADWELEQTRLDEARQEALPNRQETNQAAEHSAVHLPATNSPAFNPPAINLPHPRALPRPSSDTGESRSESIADRMIVLILWAGCCYGIQVLFEKQKHAEAEATEFAVRQERLQTAGRLAAEIAHQLKNPLGIISNAAFSLQRGSRSKNPAMDEQVAIIREEVERADRIITELMGYAQLAEGRVEKLDVGEEIDDALALVFPPAAKYETAVQRQVAQSLPSLLMQRRHLSGVLVNILQNAREALNGAGHVDVTADYGVNDSIVITIADDGPGIPPDKIDRIFDAYFTTREKGTGLGLAIVKHNTEMYGGAVRVHSKPGQGTRFVLQFPSRILMKLNGQ